ncbi:MAG TPA: hypothetical protein VL918_01815 [Sphingobium sp.]|nr:hypothetical protein [Sphingobium sp.]
MMNSFPLSGSVLKALSSRLTDPGPELIHDRHIFFSAAGSANNAAAVSGNQLAVAKSAAASATGAFAVAPGMDILSAKGEAIGTVSRVVADSHGRVQSLLVEVDDRTATLPAANFSGSGNALVSAMSEGQIKKAAKAQSSGQSSEQSSGQSSSQSSGQSSAKGSARASGRSSGRGSVEAK